MGKIILSAGHTNVPGKDRGASGNGFIEGDEAAKMRRAIYDQLKAFGADVYRDPDNTVLSEALSHFRNVTDANAICLEIHFNAATPKAKGTETFIENNPTQQERNLAEQLSKCVSDTLGIPMRGKNGVKLERESQHKNGLGWMRMPGINVLMEICFISNPNEMKSYSENFLPLCCNIANVLYQFSQSCNQPTRPVYLVKSGDYLSKIAKTHNTTVSRLKTLNGLKNDTIHVGEKLFV